MAVRRAEAHWGQLNLLAGTVLSLLRVATAVSEQTWRYRAGYRGQAVTSLPR